MNTEQKQQFAIQLGIGLLGIGMAAFRNRPEVLLPLSFGTVVLSGVSIMYMLSPDDEGHEHHHHEVKDVEKVSKSEERVIPTFTL